MDLQAWFPTDLGPEFGPRGDFVDWDTDPYIILGIAGKSHHITFSRLSHYSGYPDSPYLPTIWHEDDWVKRHSNGEA